MSFISPKLTTAVALVCFLGALCHALFAHLFLQRAKKLKNEGQEGSLSHTLFDLAGHLTFVFAFWLLPVFAVFLYQKGYPHFQSLVASADLTESFSNFSFIFLALSQTMRRFYAALVELFSKIIGGSSMAWWITCIFTGVLLDGMISEAAVMALVCSAMKERFFSAQPSARFCYTTLAVTLCSLSLGNFVAPFNVTASMDLSQTWGWSHFTILEHLSLRTLSVILPLLILSALFIRKDFQKIDGTKEKMEAPFHWNFALLGYLVAFLLCGFLKDTPFLLMAIITITLVLERGEDRTSQTDRFILPFMVAFFNYSLELHAHFIKSDVAILYQSLGTQGQIFATLGLSALNEHVPGLAFVEAFQNKGVVSQSRALLALSVGSALTLFANSLNILALKLMREKFPEQSVSGWTFLAYSAPLALLAGGGLYSTYFLY